MSINVSAVQLKKSDFLDKVARTIDVFGINPANIQVELTETCLVDFMDGNDKVIQKIADMGIAIALDDFGTGYSNLRYISEMNPDYVKIDKDFTAMAMRSEKDHELFRKIIEMVHSVNIKICIEGIEKEEWACAMKEIHVDYMQGYLYGRPCEKGVFLNNYGI